MKYCLPARAEPAYLAEMKEPTHREICSKGGKARAKSLTAAQRQKIARMGGQAKKKKHRLLPATINPTHQHE
jgi:Spy/CpxP family protein refolding chaperone